MKYLPLLSLILLFNGNLQAQNVPVEPGVSIQLATERKALINNIQYNLHFNVPNQKNAVITGKALINFDLKDKHQPIQLDFKQNANQVKKVVVNGKSTPIQVENEHLIIPAKNLAFNNSVEIEFNAGSESLNRNDEYLYALFVPDNARSAFPCFDQPDLKARYQLSLTVPQGWQALANADLKDSVNNNQQTTFNFKNSDLLPSYLFSFAVGKFTTLQKEIEGRKFTYLHRENNASKLKSSIDSVFIAHHNALNFLEDYTQIPYPYQKFGFAAIPDFQFGGMEHPGEIQYKASTLFLDEGATKNQIISRANLIYHETAHMWFGDLVTMKWFNDVWMKEVFANFMADKVTEKMMGTETFNLKFFQDHYPAAYGVDRTLGANPIRQQLDNLEDAGSMYGNIIYHKAPIMMRQLELLMGKDNFQAGIREYLKTFAHNNATWDQLIAILSKHTQNDLYAWNKVWVNLPGRPVFNYTVNYQGNKIDKFILKQKAEDGSDLIWPQTFNISLVYEDRVDNVNINSSTQELDVANLVGKEKPLYFLFNSDGLGYGLFPVDKQMNEKVYALKNPLQRASAYLNAYEAMLASTGHQPKELLNLFTQGLSLEQNEMNLNLISGYLSNIYWNFLSKKDRELISSTLELSIVQAIEKHSLANAKKLLFKTLQNIYATPETHEKMYSYWKNEKMPVGINFNEDDYTSLALTLALKVNNQQNIIVEQRDRLNNQERKNRLDFIRPALSKNKEDRDAFFDSLSLLKNRNKESWVLSALGYLHHPLQQETSINYLKKSLELVEEIKKTGDIFFPQSWIGSTFGSYQSAEAFKIVEDFLNANPNYEYKLKGKILQGTDNLRRAQKLVQ